MKKVESRLRGWGWRLRLAESLTWGVWGGVVGIGFGLALALAARRWPLLLVRGLAATAGLLTLAGVMAALAVVWLRPRSLPQLARIFDRRFGLAERLTTAVEIGVGRVQTTPTLAAAQLADALDVSAGVALRERLPLRTSRRGAGVFGMLIVALLVSLWLPNPQDALLLQRAAVQEAIAEQIEELEAAQEKIAAAEGLTEAEREALLRALEEAIAALEEGRAAPEEAIAALSEAEQALAELRDPGAQAVQSGLERAAEGLADSDLTRDIAEALAEGDYQRAAQALAAYGDTQGEALTREEELELARELTEAAQALAEGDPDLARQLAQAAEAIERGDIAEARQAIQEAARRMGEAGERVERQEAVESTLAQLQEGREQIGQAGGT